MSFFQIGQQVIYPSQGIGTIEDIETKFIGSDEMSFYALRLAENNSLVSVPVCNADKIGLRELVAKGECKKIYALLAGEFTPLEGDWKNRFREFSEKIKTGDLFDVAETYRQLIYLSRQKSLSFREQKILDKAEYLLLSELSVVCEQPPEKIKNEVGSALHQSLDATPNKAV